ncbi:BatA domain-containing protein [Phaeocystidibacter marisrubri]|uniref:Aerotolerance regulator N-terminal domain-containing protein n=1 Tax=Phaeocystidibacter marisrubri TaxID=1577780 RepID=A0A6L3ZJB7_9FLAO|nr:BatA domain-containing protein [Phaeocystidibacter marisrubri]KAB2817743.1 hypothetical protein F8C82_04885 [Phaeocystidibacter marisrubri]GGH73803.1 hypothetical protein GCM10011318_19140 [Phaeocystidibacter marisrubri]
MDFINPYMLWGLLGISIPIAIHLLQLKRYKTLYFSDIRFLKEVQQSAKKQQRIQHWIILLCRIIAWGSLTIAFALPFFPKESNPSISTNDILIYVDNSPSMSLKSGEGPLWSQAKQAAQQIVENYPNASFHILTSTLDGSDAVPLNATAAGRKINEITLSENSISWTDLAKRISTYGLKDSALFFVLTDGQSSAIENFNTHNQPIKWIPYLFEPSGSISNISIDSAWISTPVILPGQSVDVHYSIHAFGENPTQTQVELWVGNEVRGTLSIEIEPHTPKTGKFSFSAPQQQHIPVEIRIKDESVHFDDHYPIAIDTRKNLSFLDIRNPNGEFLPLESYISDSSSTVDVVSFQNIPFGSLSNYDLVVVEPTSQWPTGLAPSLSDALESGASVLVFPSGPTNAELQSLGLAPFYQSDTLKVRDIEIKSNDPFYSGVFYESTDRVKMPAVSFEYQIDNQYVRLGAKSLLSRSNGAPSLIRYPSGIGQVYQWNAHPNKHYGTSDLYPVLLYQMAIFKESKPWYSFDLDHSEWLRIPVAMRGDHIVEIVQDSLVSIPEQKVSGKYVDVNTKVDILHSGMAELKSEDEILGLIAYHANRRESDVRRLSTNDIESILETNSADFTVFEVSNSSEIDTAINEMNSPDSQSNLWIYLVIVVLLLEMILWRRPKA